jgi:hypothetical protein
VGKDNELKIPTVWQEVNYNRLTPTNEKCSLNFKVHFYQLLKLTTINFSNKNIKWMDLHKNHNTLGLKDGILLESQLSFKGMIQ